MSQIEWKKLSKGREIRWKKESALKTGKSEKNMKAYENQENSPEAGRFVKD